MEFKFFEGQIANVDYDRGTLTWVTATGRDTLIIHMTNTHIINTLGCLRGVGLMEISEVYLGKTKQEWINIFKTELRLRESE
jgi:hypothetical protein